ncbi:MAG: 3-deoxy-D-manno-octulosonic acid kinase [Marinospirillum sp.]|uniref:3-deoxy-D-manno-octulosonic acid kinase n=1 Tax=Marinospirillum sp. TaxID=2183934 RepID=UPI0019EE28A4|nr:3-deoxy-D-manno-octulosonic acid kinase [Marinospirillum sp.]MBE0505131.1 3-deoxy-D-manno-octulosonic acid kinase [Marinospirillum sp.]
MTAEEDKDGMSNFRQLDDQGRTILYDTDCIPQISSDWFEMAFWQKNLALIGGAPGRGTSVFIQTPVGEAVWRHYHRGGLPGKFVRDCYFWNGLNNTRAWQEMHLTRELYDRGFPVPQPLAAAIQRQGWFYRADLITARIPDVVPLADLLLQADSTKLQSVLQQAGKMLQPFHAAGLNHVDLNPRNLLVNPETEQVWLIDFDRCQLSQEPESRLATQNIGRLQRAFIKLNPTQAKLWLQWFMEGYCNSGTATPFCKKN